MTQARVILSRDGDVGIGRVVGEIDLANVAGVAEELRAGAGTIDALGMVVDLAEVPYVDSTGIQMLFELANHLRLSRQHLALAVAETSPIFRLFKVTHIGEVAHLCGSAEEGVEIIRRQGTEDLI